MADDRPPIRELVRQAVVAQGGRATNDDIRRYILRKYPDVKEGSIAAHIPYLTVNVPSRVNFPNVKPRLANDPRYDLLFRIDRGEVELYDPAKHGLWEIARGADGKLMVRRAEDDEIPDTDDLEPENDAEELAATFAFPLESHLRDFIAQNLPALNVGGSFLKLYSGNDGQTGVEYRTEVGPIDVLAVDESGNFVVFELKLGRGPDHALGQLLRYMGWVKRNLAGDKQVSGVIVAHSIDDKLRYAVTMVKSVYLFEYEVTFNLRPIDPNRS
jgi:hypothetical protein